MFISGPFDKIKNAIKHEYNLQSLGYSTRLRVLDMHWYVEAWKS